MKKAVQEAEAEVLRHTRLHQTSRIRREGPPRWLPLRITAIVLSGLWALGVARTALGGFDHVLAVLATALLLFEFVKNRRVNR